jgi:hypothetical protein
MTEDERAKATDDLSVQLTDSSTSVSVRFEFRRVRRHSKAELGAVVSSQTSGCRHLIDFHNTSAQVDKYGLCVVMRMSKNTSARRRPGYF